MLIFLDVISPKPQFDVIDNNKVIESLPILDQNCNKISECIEKKFLKLQKKNNLLDNLSYLVVSTGPGSFTSLRVGISFMLGISYSKNLPIYGLSGITLLSKAILEKDFHNTFLLICSANNQNFICVPYEKEYNKYETYKIIEGYMPDNVNLNIYSKCISNRPFIEDWKKKIFVDIKYLEYKSFQDNFIKNSTINLEKKSIIHPIYISENKLFD